jgi:STAM-binding protein
MAGSTLQVSKPMSVKEISAKAQDFEFNPFIALKYWLRTADTLLREVGVFPRRQFQY